VFLEACQTAQSEDDAVKSVAAALLNAGIVSVVAMTHSVLVVTAELFVREFYTHLAQGQRIGAAMLAGQRALMTDKTRFDDGSGDGFFIEDWFIPVLYQEREDPPLFHRLLPQRLQDLQHQQRQSALGDLPAAPQHTFIGRSPELLAFERLLLTTPYLVITGQGGAGKTTLAVELARWLVQTRRFNKAAFVCLEYLGDTRAVLDSIGRQLLPKFSVVEHGNEKAWLLVERELKNVRPLVLLDNCESLLPDQDGKPPLAAIDLQEFLAFCAKLQQSGATLLFTSRETLPPPFAKHHALGALSESEAIALLKQVLGLQSLELPSDAGDNKKEKLKELKSFVNRLNCHARALVLVAPIAAQKGFKATNENLAVIMAELHSAHPDDRELSLYVSLELSLRRLSAQHRQWVNTLAVFQGGFSLGVLARVLEIDDEVQELAAALVQVGLADYQNYGYFSIDPALSAYLKTQLAKDDYAQLQQQWLAAMPDLVYFLYEQMFQKSQLASQLTLLELPNLLVLLSELPKQVNAEQTATIAGRIEGLLEFLHHPQALALAVKTRQLSAVTLEIWNNEQFENKFLDIQRLLQQNQIQRSVKKAEALLKQALQAGETAYPNADYDIAMAYWLLGKVLKMGGLSEVALSPLQKAQQSFQVLADNGNQEAAGMISVTLTEQGDCLKNIGRLNVAAELYQQAINLSEKQGDKRCVAVGKVQLATVRLYQKDYKIALSAFSEAKDLFGQLNELQTVATTWHQIGMVYKAMQVFEQAENAYRESLKINSELSDKAGIANGLNELGNIYNMCGKLEPSVVFYRQAADNYTQLGDKRGEGVVRSNIADSLIKLQRYDESRIECQRAIECKKALGYHALPWQTWMILHNLEQASDNPTAAHAAKQQAILSYLAYRRDGGENMDRPHLPQLCQAVLQAIRDNNSTAVLKDLRGLQDLAGLDDYLKPVIPKLIAILQGDRDPSIVDDPELDYNSAAELLLLLEQLG
jgi:tetratricopeptide (TPR) repeat protein